MSMRRVVDGWVCRVESVLLVRGGGAELGRSFCRSGGWKSMGVGCSGGIGVCKAGVGNGVGAGKGYASLATGVGLQ
eukprot:8471564-Pyramimonas_sp.AAC.1